MEVTTSWEQKGIAKGVTQGQSSLVIQQLNRKFSTLDSTAVLQRFERRLNRER